MASLIEESQAEGEASPYPLFDFNRAVASARDLEDIFQAALICLQESLGVEKSSILLFGDDGIMHFRAWSNLSEQYRVAVDGHSPWTPETQDPQPVLVPDVRREPSLASLEDAIVGEGIISLAFFPLLADERLLGKFMLYHQEPHQYTREELLIAQTIAAHVAWAIDRYDVSQERRDQREHLEAMFHSNVVGIIEIDMSARFLTVNDRFCEMTGYSREQLLSGMDAFQITHADDRAETQHWIESLRQGAPHFTIEKRYLRPDGGEVWVSKSVTGIRDDKGIVKGAVGVITDITERKQTEQALLERNEHLEAMFHSDVVGIVEIDLDAHFVTVNDRFCELTGWSREELLSGMDAFQITHPDDRAETQHWIEGLLEGAPHFTIEKRYVRPDGGIVWVSKSVTGIRDQKGVLKGAVGVITDVTARKLSDEAIRISEQRYSDLITSLGVAVYTTDAQGYVTFYNEPAVRLWGREPMIGRDLWCGSHLIYTAEGEPLPLEDCPMAVALKEDRPVLGEEVIIERPDGTRANVLLHPMPIHDAAGNLVGAVNVLIDITDRKQVQNDLAERNELIQSMTDNMSVGLLLLDNDGAIEFMNPAAERLTGYSFDEVKGRTAHETLHHTRPDGTPYPREDCPVDNACRGMGRLFAHEDIFIKPDGTLYNAICNVAPLIRNGERFGAVLDIRDITIQKRAETALRESEESMRQAALLKDQFLGLVSHELRTPISTILGNALLLQRRSDRLTEDDKQQSLADIASEADKLQEIIENLLLLTRLEAGQMDLEPVVLQQLVQEGIDDFLKRQPDRPVTFNSDPGLHLALGESTLISLVLRNLLSNADKYTPGHGAIEVDLRRVDAGWMQVSVKDHGIGMEPQDIERVFDPFFRSQRSKPIAKGMGLGLAVCKRVIEAQAGMIWAESEPGEGSSFYFTLQPIDDAGD